MSSPIIKVEQLSKKFVLSHEGKEKYKSLRDEIVTKGKRLVQKQQRSKTVKEEFYALKDVNFEIHQGDRLGIIGRNGAGKSTLLKILSRITEPTSGRITLRGRVASLLEVGTGFHPELTGRENIFLNGAILGMGRKEIRQKFDEIVDFAEVERFLDTPVKRYSSGMYVRLAFAVAAHLEPEILIVDEVLAVGDAQFQKKCLGKMEKVSVDEGRTVLFVSHNMGVIAQLCKTAIWMDKGQMQLLDNVSAVIQKYSSSGYGQNNVYVGTKMDSAANFALIETYLPDGTLTNSVLFDQDIILKCRISKNSNLSSMSVGFALLDTLKHKVFTSHFHLEKSDLEGRSEITLQFAIPKRTIVPGFYSFDAALFKAGAEGYEYLSDICHIEIVDSGHQMSYDTNFGSVLVDCKWDFI